MISVPGVGSGLDVNSIVSQLIAVEGDTKTLLLANKQEGINAEITAFGSLKSLLSNFQSSTLVLKLPSTFESTVASSSDESVFTASAIGTVSPGVFDIEVRNLAESHKLLTAGFTDVDTVIGEGVVTLSVGASSFDITIDSSNSTVTGVRDAINDATDNTGVSASIITVDDGTGNATLTKLVITAENTGSASALTLTVNDTDTNHTDSSGLSALYYDTSDVTTPEQLSQINAASDAEVYIEGQKVLSDSNIVVDAVQGVTLNLLAADTGTNYTLNLAENKAGVASSIALFVSSYNSFVSLTNNFTAFDVDSGDAGIFLGDATIRTLRNQVRSEITNAVDDIAGPFAMLVDIGITTQADGSLQIDSTELDNALNTNFDGVSQLFSSSNGIAVKLNDVLTEYTKSDGIIDSKTKGLNTTIDGIEKDFEALNDKLEALEERLLAQFSGLDVLLSQLNSTSNFLTQQFEIIGNIFKKN